MNEVDKLWENKISSDWGTANGARIMLTRDELMDLAWKVWSEGYIRGSEERG